MGTTINTDVSANIKGLVHNHINQYICPRFIEYYKKKIIEIGSENYKLNKGTAYAFLYKGEEFNYYNLSPKNLETLHPSLNNKMEELCTLKKNIDKRSQRIIQFFLYCVDYFKVNSYTGLTLYIPIKYHGCYTDSNLFSEAASEDIVFKRMWDKVEPDLDYLLGLNLIL